MSVVTRFAPSPTGLLHIGGARTALFNWLYARHHGGRFLLRIEDTDRARSTDDAVRAIVDGLAWLGLDGDEEPVFQSTRAARHAEVARDLLAAGRAYRCYRTPEELAEMRAAARAAGRSTGYDGYWRDRDPAEAPPGVPPVIRFKAPREGNTVIADRVQGEVRIANAELDDMVLLRADGSPTYMLSVVVDDHDSGITHVIRGDDHLNNAARQSQLIAALGWTPPAYAHIPLIHGADGARLSKRHGALGVAAYREAGYLPEPLRNYLLRLGWAHGDDEIVATAQAIAWFDLDGVGRAPARFDPARLDSLNAHYLRQADDDQLCRQVEARVDQAGGSLDAAARRVLRELMPELKRRPKTLAELTDNSSFIWAARPLTLDPKADRLLTPPARTLLGRLCARLAAEPNWSAPTLEPLVRDFAVAEGMKLGAVAQPLRAALTGRAASPGIFEVLVALGRAESLARLDDATGSPTGARRGGS